MSLRWLARILVVFVAVCAAWRAQAGEASDLLFFSGDLISGRGYAGGGWLHAFSGLDASGLVFSLEGGRPQDMVVYGAAQTGWRFVETGVYLTLMGGFDAEPRLRPIGSADLWWEPARGWMAQARIEAAPDWTSWRIAAGWRPKPGWPWIGPEAAASAGWPRVGVHATGLVLPGGVEARVSVGAARGERRRVGPYGEVSLWRRF